MKALKFAGGGALVLLGMLVGFVGGLVRFCADKLVRAALLLQHHGLRVMIYNHAMEPREAHALYRGMLERSQPGAALRVDAAYEGHPAPTHWNPSSANAAADPDACGRLQQPGRAPPAPVQGRPAPRGGALPRADGGRADDSAAHVPSQGGPAMIMGFVSDLHLGRFDLSDERIEAQAALLRWLRLVVDEVVVLGDFTDTWTFPVDREPLSHAAILESPRNEPVVEACRAVVAPGAPTRLRLVRGNHDADTSTELLQTHFRSATVDESYTRGFVWGEHGHRFDLFNAPDFHHRPQDGMPLGYFVARVWATAIERGRGAASAAGVTRFLIDQLGQVEGSEHARDGSGWTVASLVLGYAMAEAGLDPADEVVMPGGDRIKLGEVSALYADLFADWEREKGLLRALLGVSVAMENMTRAAGRVRTEKGKRLVVFGHSHRAEYTDVAWGQDLDGGYANDGALCTGNQGVVLVEERLTPSAGDKPGYRITCARWDKDKPGPTSTHELAERW